MEGWKPTKSRKCRWIVLTLPNTKPKAFRLDDNGNLQKTNGVVRPDPSFEFPKFSIPNNELPLDLDLDLDYNFDILSPPPSPIKDLQPK